MVNGPLWTAEYDPERPRRSEALPPNITAPPVAVCAGRRGDRMRRREIAAYVWVHPPSRRTTVRIAEGGRKKLHQLYWCCAIKAHPAAVGKPSYDPSHCRSRVVSHLLFSCQVSECLSTHSAACFSVVEPLITSVSPSGQRISTTQPSPGFFRATKISRYSDILRI
jgi:hypothetical protein